ncbi:MAG: GIY-YIG nuclease family protein [Cyclobacteriaceae bacterium]
MLKDRFYTVYVLYSIKFDRLYVGFSSHFIVRFHFHNQFSKKGFTIQFRPWIAAHLEYFDSKSEAMKREKELKSGQGRAWIRAEVLPMVIQLFQR